MRSADGNPVPFASTARSGAGLDAADDDGTASVSAVSPSLAKLVRVDSSYDEVGERPRLRGWIHLGAAPVAAVAAYFLWRAASPGLPQLSIAVFGVALFGLYATSGLYHVPSWSPRARWLLSRADVVMIQLFIAASFTPLAVHALSGAWRTWSLAVAWGIGILGAVIAASPIRGPRWLTVAAYFAFGWLAIVPFVRLVQVLPWEAVALLAVSGSLYTIGGIIYVRQRPDPWPDVFGFHEVFHTIVVVAAAAHMAAVWQYALPLA